MKKSFLCLLTVVITLLMLGCSFSISVPSVYFEKVISAQTGGKIMLPRGIEVDFPPGTFTSDRFVSIGFQDRTQLGSSIVMYSTDPFSLLQPITITIPSDVLELRRDEVLIVQPIFGEAYIERVSADFDDIQEFGISSVTKNGDTILKVKGGFPYCIIVGKADALYSVLHLPGKYLLEGDLLYYIDMNWFPGHAGLYLGIDEDTAYGYENLGYNDGITFADSYPYQSYGANLAIEEGVFVFPNNVDPSPYVPVFRYDSYEERWTGIWADKFLGPRRYNGKLTPEDRRDISRYVYEAFRNGSLWTVGFAWRGYTPIPFSKKALYSCVGLPEKAYQSTGKNIVPFWSSLFYLTTSEQYSRTIPIPEITETLGETIRFRVNGLVAQTATGCSPLKQNKCIEVEGWKWVSSNGVALLSDNVGSLRCFYKSCEYEWTPEEAGSYEVVFSFFADVDGEMIERVQSLTIHIDPD